VEKFQSSLKSMLLISQSEIFLQPGNSNRGTRSSGKIPSSLKSMLLISQSYSFCSPATAAEEPEVVEMFRSSLKSMPLISQSELFLQPGNSRRGTGSCGKVPEQPEEHAINQSIRTLFAARQQQERNRKLWKSSGAA
jgi:hypothetical protein